MIATQTTTPGEAKFYRTARFTVETIDKIKPRLLHDGFVKVVYLQHEYNAMYGCDEAIYMCYDHEGLVGTFFERALENFVL